MAARLVLAESEGRAQVLFQPQGQLFPEPQGPPEPLTFPLSAEELEDLRWYLEDYLGAPYAVYEDRGRAIAGRLREWGERLFAAVFGPGRPGRGAYLEARAADAAELWISSASPAVLALPWELLHDPDRPEPLAMDLAAIHRTIPADEQPPVRPTGERLRVLMVIARPGGPRDVRYRAIARPLFERLQPVAGEVRIDLVRPPTLDELGRRLDAAVQAGEPYHILHFDGHGGFVGRRQGILLFEKDDGDRDPVTAEALASVLASARVPLLVFNACKSGKVDGAAASPEAAVAARLLAGGAAAVVAMGYNVYAVAAAEFMAAFYEALFAGETVSRAVAAGRRQLAKADQRPSPRGYLPLADWIVPVLYARTEVAFPDLERRTRSAGASLAEALAALRPGGAEPPAGESVHAEGSVEPTSGLFFGRDGEVLTLERALRTQRVAVLNGVGGTGKTELAKAFARWLRDSGGLDDPGHVFFHSFEPGVATFGLDGVLASVGLRLLGTDFLLLDRERRRETVLQAVKTLRLLLIWDNFETVHSMPDPAGVTKPLDEAGRQEIVSFLEEVKDAARGGVIVTSRSPEAWLGGGVFRLEVEGLDPADANDYAEALLTPFSKARERREDPVYAELLRFLGGHPLSLRLVLPRLEEATPSEILASLRGERALSSPEGDGRLGSLDACVHYSIRQLPAEHRRRLPALTLFEGVADMNVLANLSDRAPARFSGLDHDAWTETLGACASAGLLTPLGFETYRIHPALPRHLSELWREQAAGEFEAEREMARIASIEGFAILSNWLVRQIQRGDAETASAMLAIEQRSLGHAAAEALRRGLFLETRAILEALKELWRQRGLIDEARAWAERCREAVEPEDGAPLDLEAPAGALWSFILFEQTLGLMDSGALDEAETRLEELRTRIEPSDSHAARQALGAILLRLGVIAQRRHDLTSAVEHYLKALQILQELQDRHQIAQVSHQLATLRRVQGDLPEAERLSHEALAILREIGDQPTMALSYRLLGMVAQDRGDYRGAELWYRRALEIEAALGNQPEVADLYHHLGLVAFDRDNLPAAESWLRRSLAISEALGDRASVATTYIVLGSVAQARGDLAAAEAWGRRSLQVFETLDRRSEMAHSYHELGRVAQQRGDLASAEAFCRKALEIRTALDDRVGMVALHQQLGNVALLRGDLAAAESWYRKVLAFAEEVDNRPNRAKVYGQMGLLAEVRGNADEALDWTVRCVALFPELPHPATGPGPHHLVRLTALLGGIPVLAASWQRVTGEPLPEAVGAWVATRLTQATS